MRAAILALAAAASAAVASAGGELSGGRAAFAWMCLERCNDTSADIQAQVTQMAANQDALTDVMFELYNLGPNSTLVVNNLTDVNAMLKRAAPRLRRHAMLSSYPYPPEFLDWMREVWANPQPFIDACIAAAAQNSLSGFNVDWEPTTPPAPSDAVAYAAFLDTFATALRREGLWTSVDFASWSPIWNVTALAATAVDWVVDMGTYAANVTIFQQQLQGALAALPDPASRAKLVVGIESTNANTGQPWNATDLAPRFVAMQQAGLRAVGIWRAPIPDAFWPFLHKL